MAFLAFALPFAAAVLADIAIVFTLAAAFLGVAFAFAATFFPVLLAAAATNLVAIPDDKPALFDIKKLNDIDDKMLRGSAKKIYMAGKRSEKSSQEVVDEIKNIINESDKMTPEIEKLLGDLI